MQRRPIFPQAFTQGLKKVSGDFMWGIWGGMSPGHPKYDPNQRQTRDRRPVRKPRDY